MAMTLNQAWRWIRHCAREMNIRYNGVVFDELAIVSFADNQPRTLSYQGPRRQEFDLHFPSDSTALRALVRSGTYRYGVGDFEFSHQGTGTLYDAFVVLGGGVCLVCNNTTKPMPAISANPLWLAAQIPLAELAERFRVHPLVLDRSPAPLSAEPVCT